MSAQVKDELQQEVDAVNATLLPHLQYSILECPNCKNICAYQMPSLSSNCVYVCDYCEFEF